MEVNFSSLRSRASGQVERVGIKNSSAARDAEAVGTLALLRLLARLTVGRGSWRQLREAQADLRLDPSAIGAEPFRLEHGDFVANSTNLLDLFRRSSDEKAQTCIEHHGPLLGRTREDGGLSISSPLPSIPHG